MSESEPAPGLGRIVHYTLESGDGPVGTILPAIVIATSGSYPDLEVFGLPPDCRIKKSVPFNQHYKVGHWSPCWEGQKF